MEKLFETADRKKYRFPTRKGNASCEDLWDLSLPALDIVARTIDEMLNTKSYIEAIPKDKEILDNKFKIVKYIIETKIKESNPDISPEPIKVEKPKFL